VRVPPRVDLGEWPTIGIVDFATEGDPALGELATARFVEMLQDAQPGSRLVELGSEVRLLAEIEMERFDFEAVRALGDRYRVDAVIAGTLELSKVKPNVKLGEAFTSLRASANLDGELAARLLEARSGAIAWSRSARASENVAHLGMSGGSLPTFRVGDPGDAATGLVSRLVSNLSADFHPTWREE
jgi:hypothetical protein